MSAYELIFLIVAVAVISVAAYAGNWRGVIWGLAIVGDAVLSDLYISTGWPVQDGIMAGLDVTVAGAIYYVAAARWERRLFLVMLFSALISLVHLGFDIFGVGIDQEIYLSSLELANYVAMIVIGGISGFVFAGRQDGRSFDPWPRLGWAVHPRFRTSAQGRR